MTAWTFVVMLGSAFLMFVFGKAILSVLLPFWQERYPIHYRAEGEHESYSVKGAHSSTLNPPEP